ncbi:hypothetical protein EC844_10391 [Acinetobacter calcoaceticus]|uniref:Uncharacterized protein n=1 Tax=Acinetobacter calcoaceticus TaxID=471 RepID=A0A4R1XYD8_ACICA|nr:hypothetical protein EC844_10391 [Acinetobacter calcoaceticus]
MKELNLEQIQQVSGAGIISDAFFSAAGQVGGSIGGYIGGQIGSQLGLESIGTSIGKVIGQSAVTIGKEVSGALSSALWNSVKQGGTNSLLGSKA